MSRKAPEVNPHQGSLLTPTAGNRFAHSETFPSDPAEKLLGHQDSPPIVYGEPGSYVDITDRARLLTGALTNLGYRNQRRGFDLASNSRQYSGPIWERYRRGTPIVQEGAASNREKFLQEAKENFWQATGYAALRNTDLVPAEEVNAGARLMWRRFSTQYADPENRTARDRYKQQLNQGARIARRVINRKAA